MMNNSSPGQPKALDRRTFLQLGTTGTVLLATSSTALALSGQASTAPAEDFKYLTETDIPFLKAISRNILGEGLPTSSIAQSRAINACIEQIDNHCSFMSPELQKILRQLLDTATLPLTKGITTGVWSRWEKVSRSQTEAFLNHWQHSSIGLFRMSHASLVQLVSLSWFGLPQSFQESHYPGPLYPELLVTTPNHY